MLLRNGFIIFLKRSAFKKSSTMSKRKSSVDLRHGFNVPRRRPSIANLQARPMSVIHRKPGATNVRSTSSYKVVRSHADTQRNSSNVPGAWKSSVTRNETTKMPKTRFNLASGSNTHTSRLKYFPVETVRRTVASWSYSPALSRKPADLGTCKRAESPPMEENTYTQATDLPTHGYGDTLILCPADELKQRSRQVEQNSQSPKKAVTICQQYIPNEQNVGKINQSEAMLNERVRSPGPPIHRPFVPNVAHGMIVRTSSAQKTAISPRLLPQQSCAIRTEHHQPQQREKLSLTAVEQTQRPQISVCHQVSQMFRQSGDDQSNQTAPTSFRNMIPWKIDDTPAVCDYEIQPIGGRNATTGRGRTSGLDEKLDTQRQVVTTGQPTASGQETCDHAKQQQKQQARQQQLHQHQQQQQQHRYANHQALSNMQTLQNARQMYQQLQNNMIRQQEMQQMALHQQQKIMSMTQQQIRQQPQLKMTVQGVQMDREPCSNFYDQQQTHSGQLPNSTSDIHTNKMNIPHYRMLMQQQNARFRSLQTSPQHGWAHDQQVISDRSRLRGQLPPFQVNLVSSVGTAVLSNNVKRCPQLEETEAQPMANQPVTQQLAGMQWTQATQCPQYEARMREQPPIQHMQQKPNPALHQQYLAVQTDQQVSTAQPKASMVYGFQQTQPRQQQPQMTKKCDPSGSHRLSQTDKKQYPQFTIDMIRDQELLVANMRQQKIPENIMRRQFDALLGEQRRHLAFLSGQEQAEKLNDTPPRASSRAFHVDQRPDWMANITPARTSVQPTQNSSICLNQQGTARDRQGPMVPEEIKQYDQTEQQISGHVLNDTQHSIIPPHLLHNLNRQGVYHSWQRPVANQQYGTALSASLPYSGASLPQMLSPPQDTFSWSQQNNDPRIIPQCHSVKFTNLQAQCPQQLPEQRPFQRQCQQQSPMRYELRSNQPQQMPQIQQKSINCQQTPQVEQMTPEQYQQHEKMMLQADNGKWSNNPNGTCCKPDAPSSLLKLREFQRYIRPQKQFNGLQDVETVIAALEALKSPVANKGLEYVAELGKKVTALKLNGTQDPSQLEKVPPPPVEYLQRIQQQQQPKISSNGLCNTRNANNPAPPPISFRKTMDQSPSVGYPRQYYPGEKPLPNMSQETTHKMMAEKENGSVANTMQQLDFPDTVFPGSGQAMGQYFSSQTTVRGVDPPQQIGRIDGRCQRLTIPRNGKTPTELQRIVPIMPYKFDASKSLYERQMEHFYRNQMNLKNSVENSITTPLKQGPSTSNSTAPAELQVLPASSGNTVQPYTEASDTQRSPRPDCNYKQESSPTGQIANYTDKLHHSTRVVGNKEAIAPQLMLHQATADSHHGQPEIREPKTFGGLTYLARKVDYLQNPPIIAPNTFIASKFLQPSINFN